MSVSKSVGWPVWIGRPAQLTSMANALRVNMGAVHPVLASIPKRRRYRQRSPTSGSRQGPARERVIVRNTEHPGARRFNPTSFGCGV